MVEEILLTTRKTLLPVMLTYLLQGSLNAESLVPYSEKHSQFLEQNSKMRKLFELKADELRTKGLSVPEIAVYESQPGETLPRHLAGINSPALGTFNEIKAIDNLKLDYDFNEPGTKQDLENFLKELYAKTSVLENGWNVVDGVHLISKEEMARKAHSTARASSILEIVNTSTFDTVKNQGSYPVYVRDDFNFLNRALLGAHAIGHIGAGQYDSLLDEAAAYAYEYNFAEYLIQHRPNLETSIKDICRMTRKHSLFDDLDDALFGDDVHVSARRLVRRMKDEKGLSYKQMYHEFCVHDKDEISNFLGPEKTNPLLYLLIPLTLFGAYAVKKAIKK